MTGLLEKAGASPPDRSSLIPLLQRAQNEAGCLTPAAVEDIADILGITESQVFGVASFYSQFRFKPRAKHCINVCLGTACHVQGGELLLEALHRELGVKPGEQTEDMQFEVHRVACLGCCALAPVIAFDESISSMMTVTKLQQMLGGYEHL